jgi:hypothetical protein
LAYPYVIEIDRKKYFALQAQKTEIEKKIPRRLFDSVGRTEGDGEKKIIYTQRNSNHVIF